MFTSANMRMDLRKVERLGLPCTFPGDVCDIRK